MKILIYGNANNMPLLLAEGLRDIGCDVTLIVNRKEQLHRPEGLDTSYAVYPDWIIDLSDLSFEDLMYGSRIVEQKLSELSERSDFAILNDVGASLYSELDCPHGVFSTGSDVTWYANPLAVEQYFSGNSQQFMSSKRGQTHRRKFQGLINRQREGIRKADVVFAPPSAIVPDLNEILDGIGVRRRRRHFICIADTIRNSPTPVPSASLLRILCAARLTATNSGSNSRAYQDSKGTEILLAGMKNFVNQGYNANLMLPEKGDAIDQTKELVHQLGLAPVVTWYQEETQEEFHARINSAHVVVDSVGKSFPGLSYTAAIASGRCVLANLYPGKMPYDLPGLHADRPDDVAACLVRVDKDRQYLQEISTAGAHFASSQISPTNQAEKALRFIKKAVHKRRVKSFIWNRLTGFIG